jgi:uncharacterized protein YndB with AHSA1/START domain
MFKHSGNLTVTLPSDREIAMSRTFNAPRRLVFDAYTKCEIVTRWLGVFGEWKFRTCKIDLTVGGKYRYEWDGPDGQSLALGGTFKEIVRDERLVATETFDAPFDMGEALNTITFVEKNGRTTMTITAVSPSKEVRDGMIKNGMTDGVTVSFDNLEEILAKQTAAATT